MRPPRAVFVDFPLGHTAGPPDEPAAQRAIVGAALEALTSIDRPGTIVDLGLAWPAGEDWKHAPEPDDARKARSPEPQYQFDQDRTAAVALHEAAGCHSCIGIDA